MVKHWTVICRLSVNMDIFAKYSLWQYSNNVHFGQYSNNIHFGQYSNNIQGCLLKFYILHGHIIYKIYTRIESIT